MKLLITGSTHNPWSHALLKEVPKETNKTTILLASAKQQILTTIPARIAGYRVLWLGSSEEQPAITKTLLNSVARFTHNILVPNQSAEAQYLKLNIPSQKISLIYPGFSLIQPITYKGEEIVIGCDGSVGIEHGLGTILQGVSLAKQILGNIRLVIGGAIKGRNRIEWLAKELGLQASIQIIPSQSFSWIQPCHLFLLIQKNNAEVPFSIGHALGYSKPVVATDQLNHHEFIQNEKNGLLLKNPNQDMLSQALINLARNPDWLLKLAYGSAAFARSRFDTKNIQKKIKALALEN